MMNGSIPDDMETNPNLRYTPDALKRADIICSTFTVMEWRKRLFGFAETLQSAELLMINKNETAPSGFSELAGKRIAFMGGTSFEEHLREINAGLSEQNGAGQNSSSSSKEIKNCWRKARYTGLCLMRMMP